MLAPMGHAHTGSGPTSERVPVALAVALAPFVVATLLGLLVLWPGETGTDLGGLGAPSDLVDATVVATTRGACEGTPTEAEILCTSADVRIEQGPDRGETITLSDQPDTPGVRLDVGDRIVLGSFPDAPPGFEYAYADRERRGSLYLLAGLFAVAVVVLGRWGGLRALIGLVVSGAVIVFFVLPALLEGSNPLVVALVGSSAVALVALFLAHGVNARTATAVLGTLLSLGLVGVLGTAFVAAAEFTGLATEEATFLQVTAGQVDLRGLILGGIVIGALGVLDDVTVTQVSAVHELRRAASDLGPWPLYRAAVRIGRDHIASTVNTLVLAYAGASLPLLLLFTQAEQSMTDVLNGEAVAVEVVRTLVGSIGLVCSVPLTTGLAVLVTGRSSGAEPSPPSDDPRDYRSAREASFWEDDAVGGAG